MDTEEPHLPSEALLAVSVLFAPLAFGTTESWSRACLAGLLTLLAFLRYRRFGGAGLLPSRLPPLFWAYAALIAFALLQAANPASPLALPLAHGPFTVSRRLTLEWVFDWSLYASALLLLPAVFRTQASAERLAWWVLACGALIAVVGIAQQQAGNTHYYGLRPVSVFRAPFGPYPNKNHAATYLCASALLGAGLFAAALQKARAFREDRRLDEFFGRLAIIAALEFLVLTGLVRAHSRGALVAGGMAGALAAVVYWKGAARTGRRAAFVGAAAAALLIPAFAWHSGIPLGSYLPQGGENSVTFRAAMIQDGVDMVRAFPWTGVGLGALRAAYPLWQSPVMTGFTTDHLHCDPVQLAAEAGLPLALAYYAGVLATFVLAALSLTRARSNALPLSFLAAGAAFFFHQLTDFPAQIASLHFLAATAVAVAWGVSRGDSAPPAPAPPSARRVFAAGALALLWAVLLAPRLGAAYFDLLAARYPQPSRQYFQFHAVRLEGTFERHLALAASFRRLAFENPTAARPLLVRGLAASTEALRLEPANRAARITQAAILRSLGRAKDARRLE